MFGKNKVSDQVIVSETAKRIPRRRRKKLWIALCTVMLCGALLVVGVFAIGSLNLIPQNTKAEASNYQVVGLSTGTLSQSVTGSGSVEMNSTASVSVPADLTIDTVNVVAGENVKSGDTLVTLNKKSIQDKIDTLTTDLATLNSELAALSGDTTSSTVAATVKGRVKIIYATKGDDIATVMRKNGALMILSIDGYMKIEAAVPATSVTLADSVNVVTSSGTVLEGTVSTLSEDFRTATLLVSDKTLAQGENVTIKNSSGVILGTGVAEINNPLRITGTAGTVKSLSVSVNSAVSKNSTLMTLTNLPISEEYAVKLAAREACLDDIATMQAYLKNPTIKSTYTGIIHTIDLTGGQKLTEDATILLTVRDKIGLSVSVDELDILKIQPGMQAKVTLDAIEDETFTGTITKILANGTTSNNVTTYPVVIELTDDERFLPGMSASADIVVKESVNALLVPVSALNTARGESFVYVYNGSSTESASGEPGIRTAITTGLSNDEYAEVLSGLSQNDQIVVVRSALSSSSSQQRNMGMMNFGGAMPSGGMPSGGMPSGGTINRGSGGTGGGNGGGFPRG